MSLLKIGSVRLRNRLFLAPMVDVTDLPFRVLCRKYGAGMAYTEMLYIDAILHENRKTKLLMKTCEKDKPVGLQVTGNNVKEFEKLAGLEELSDYDLIDINCGCPSIRITGSEAGSFLLRTPKKIGEMIKTLKAGDSERVVTAKIRLGFDNNNVLKVSHEIERAGADAVVIHARLATQKSNVSADWKWIVKVKREIGIPVIGNGGVNSGEKASEMLDICDGAMVASGAVGNPFIFREILRYLKTGKEREITKKEKISSLWEYLKLEKKFYGKDVDLSHVKYVSPSFLKGFEGVASLREKFMKCKSMEEVEGFVKKLI